MPGHKNRKRNQRLYREKLMREGPPDYIRPKIPIIVGATYITPYGWIKPRQVLNVTERKGVALADQTVTYRTAQSGRHFQCKRTVFITWMTDHQAQAVGLNAEGYPQLIEEMMTVEKPNE